MKSLFTKLASKLLKATAGKDGTTFCSYKAPLSALCTSFTFHNVLEFGPGGSTEILLKNTTARVISYETNDQWYHRYKDAFDLSRVDLRLRPVGWDLQEIQQLLVKLDLVIVDAGARADQLSICEPILPDEAMVFLHDAHREEYETGIKHYPYCHFCDRHSCILTKSPQMFERVAELLPLDDSCRCKYCGTKERREYFERMKTRRV